MIKMRDTADILLNYDFLSKFNFVRKNLYFYALKCGHGFCDKEYVADGCRNE